VKALTVTQPWATLIAVGAKHVETRSWTADYRGLLAIHAAHRFPGRARELCQTNPFRLVLDQVGIAGPKALPCGMVVATCRLTAVHPTSRPLPAAWPAGCYEVVFRDHRPGRYAWLLTDVTPLTRPVRARGTLGLWTWAPGQPLSALGVEDLTDDSGTSELSG
jgi:activating signal cointegrator 1